MRTILQERLKALSDTGYAEFQRKLIPTVSPERIVGVRTPVLRSLAKEMLKSGEADAFIAILPHPTFEENQLHAFILSELKDFQCCLREVVRFLPYIDNWATCDQLSPKCFRRHTTELLPCIVERNERSEAKGWLQSEHEYTVRFGIGMLMQHFLDEKFSVEYADMVAAIQSEEYYVNMMIAWYFATALAKQYEAVLPYIEEKRLAPWVHNKAIQKSVESYRITPEQKEYLRTLKVGRK